MSYHTLTTKPLNAGLKLWLKRGGHIGLGLGAFAPVLAMANPTGGHVVAGSATITTPSANGTVVSQTSQNAIINWQQFNIGSGQYVQFLQPSSSSVVLNRVIGGGGSSILGNLTGNGQIFLVNTNGVFFGKGASVDAQGFLASTLDITDSNFLNHNFVFNKSGSDAQIVNQGNITAHQGGYVVLAGDYAENDGVIAAQSGHVVLASGAKSTLTLNGNSLVSYAVNQATLAQLAGVDNAGKLQADGGAILMTADVANLLKATVVNNSGLVEARAISKAGGTIQLLATGGNIINAGTLNAAAMKAGLQGGDITLKGDARTTLTNTSKIYATGEGAKGGSVEVSGNTISLRGAMTLGKGGNLLLDPAHLELVTTAGTGEAGAGTGSTDGKAFSTVGVDFIQTQLNAGAAVAISAHSFINASSNVHAIKATGTGGLILHVGKGGQISLGGVTIAIGGGLSAFAGVSNSGTAAASFSFGRITATGIDIDVGLGKVTLANDAVVNNLLQPSLKATNGSVLIQAANLAVLSSGSLTVQATKKIDIDDAPIITAGNITLTAGSEIKISKLVSGKNITLTAASYLSRANTLDISAAGNITLKGAIGSAPSPSLSVGFDAALTLTAGGKITVDHSIYVDGTGNGIAIQAQGLTYTGKAAEFVISAASGGIVLDAAVATAAAPVKGGVRLSAHGDIDVERSIFAATGISIGVTGASSDVTVGNSDSTAITLSAKGPIALSGDTVKIGGTAPVTITADDMLATTTADNLTIQGGKVHIGGSDISASNQSLAAVTVDHSVTLHAGHDVLITNSGSLQISAATAHAKLGGSGGALTAKGDVSITAGHDINFQAKRIGLHAGNATAAVSGDIKSVATVVAEANVSLNAGNDVILHAAASSDVGIFAGQAEVTAVTAAAKQKASATASAGVSIKAGHDMTLSGGLGVSIFGGNDAASGAQVIAAQSGAKASAIAHADTILSAGHAISVTGHAVSVRAGAGVAGAHASFISGGSTHQVTWSPTQVSATGQTAAALLTATANVSLKAGAGGIALDANSTLSVDGGNSAALAVQIDAGSLGGKASVDAEAKLSLAATGAVSLVAADTLHVRGGASAGRVAQSSSSTHHGTSGSRTITGSQAARLHAGAGGTASLKTDVSVSITAGGALSLADTNLAGSERLSISAGARPAGSIGISATGAFAAANVAIDTAVSLSAGKGGLTVETHTNSGGALKIFAGAIGSGAQIASHASVSADFGAKAGLAIDSRVVLSTKGDLELAARREVEVEGGSHGFQSAVVHASSGAATASLQDGVALTAGGVFAANAASSVGFVAAQHQAQSDSVSAVGTGAKATLNADGRISVSAGGGFNLGAKFFAASAGRHIGSSADITGSAGGSATLTAKAGISFVGGGNFTLNGGGSGNLRIIGGFGAHDDVTATHGKAALNQDGSVLISVTGNLDLLAPAVFIAAGSGAVGASDHVSVTRGSATVTGLDGIALKAGKEFVASGAGSGTASGLSIAAGHSVGGNAVLSARGPGSKLVMRTKAGISIAAGSDGSLKGKHLFTLFAGNDVAHGASIHASSGAVLNDSASAGLNITAGTTFLATAQAAKLIMVTGFAAGESDSITVNHGTATFKADAGLHVTAKTSLTLTGGSGGMLETRLKTASHDALHAVAGTINANVLSDLSLTAGGALHTSMVLGLSIGAGEASSVGNAVAANDDLSAQGVGTKINLLANGGVTLKGGAVTLDAGAILRLGAYGSVAQGASIAAASGAVVSETGLAGLNIKASGAFQASAGSLLTIKGGIQTGQSLDVRANGPSAKATVVADASVGISAMTVTMNVNSLHVTGGNDAGASMDAQGGSGGAATVSLASQVKVNATGTLTLAAIGGVMLSAGSGGGNDAHLDADHGKMTLAITSGVALTAGGNLSMDMGTGSMSLRAAHGGSGQQISAGPAGTVSDKVDSSLLLKSGAKLTLSHIVGFTGDAGDFGSATQPAVNITGTGKVSGLLNGSLSILGTSVTTSTVSSFSHNTAVGFNDDGVVFKTGITVSGGVGVLSLRALAPRALGTVQHDALIMSMVPALSSAPAGEPRPSTLFLPGQQLDFGSAACGATRLDAAGGLCRLIY